MTSNGNCGVTAQELLDCLYTSAFAYLSAIDWASEAQYIGGALALTAVIVLPSMYLYEHGSHILPDEPPPWLQNLLAKLPSKPTWLDKLGEKLYASSPRRVQTILRQEFGIGRSPQERARVYLCPPPRPIYDPAKDFTRRIEVSATTVTLFAYPSKGGVIVLSPAYPPDFDFLALDRLNPPSKRHEASEEEDEFCKNLLLLGAKWWDSLSRYYLVTGALSGEESYQTALEYDVAIPRPTSRECAWLSIAWPSTGGLVISEYVDSRFAEPGIGGAYGEVPDDVGRLALCRDMDERAKMLKEEFEGDWYGSVEEYAWEDKNAFLGAWDTKVEGEVGELEITW